MPFTLLGITADYIAPDGCYCLNGDQWIRIGDSIDPTGNYFDLKEPVSSRRTLMTVEISRDVRPPLMIQTPADCDYGDIRLKIKLWIEKREEREVRYFRFQAGGHLLPIDAPRDVRVYLIPTLLKCRVSAKTTPRSIRMENRSFSA